METIYIAVCDDDTLIHNEVEKLLAEYREARTCEFEIFNYFSAQMLLEASDEYHILLLDIDMPGMDGIQAAEQLKKSGKQCNVIMLTAKRERFKEAFKIGATRFVTKPIEKEELFEAFDSAIQSFVGYESVTVKYNGKDCTFRQRDICMVEAKGDYVKIYLKDKVFESNQSLKDFAEKLDDRIFLSVHRSYLVNMLYVCDIKNGYLELSGGKKVPVARRKSKDVLQKIIDFDVNYR